MPRSSPSDVEVTASASTVGFASSPSMLARRRLGRQRQRRGVQGVGVGVAEGGERLRRARGASGTRVTTGPARCRSCSTRSILPGPLPGVPRGPDGDAARRCPGPAAARPRARRAPPVAGRGPGPQGGAGAASCAAAGADRAVNAVCGTAVSTATVSSSDHRPDEQPGDQVGEPVPVQGQRRAPPSSATAAHDRAHITRAGRPAHARGSARAGTPPGRRPARCWRCAPRGRPSRRRRTPGRPHRAGRGRAAP